MLLHINAIFIHNKIRDYLSIFRCSSSSKPGQCCLHTFGTTSELSHWLLFHVCQEWDFGSSNASCRWQEVYLVHPAFMKSTMGWFYFRLPSQIMNVNLFLQQTLCANKISKRNPVTVHSYWTSWLLNCMRNGWFARHFLFLHLFKKYLFGACFVPSM